MGLFFWDWTLVLLIPPLLFTIWAQMKVKSTYHKFSQVATQRGLTGAQVAEAILRNEHIDLAHDPSKYPAGSAVGLEAIPGELTDHYDPRARMLRLSQPIYNGQSIAALGIAAHEVGHAIQHSRLYSPLMLRNVVYPICGFGETVAFPLFFIGLFFPAVDWLMPAGIALFSLAVFFTVLTLPVEFNASSRAMRALASGGYLTDDELRGARKVLTAAALTYVAAAAMAIMNLVRLLLIAAAHRD